RVNHGRTRMNADKTRSDFEWIFSHLFLNVSSRGSFWFHRDGRHVARLVVHAEDLEPGRAASESPLTDSTPPAAQAVGDVGRCDRDECPPKEEDEQRPQDDAGHGDVVGLGPGNRGHAGGHVTPNFRPETSSGGVTACSASAFASLRSKKVSIKKGVRNLL